MSIITQKLEVTTELDAGKFDERIVVADQRDFAAFEGSDYFSDMTDRTHTKIRYWAWHALRRAGLVKSSFESWGKTCIQVFAVPDAQDSEGEQTENPTEM